MATHAHTVLPPGWKRPKGYSNAVVLPKGRPLFVAGMVGWNEDEQIVSDDFAVQFRQALKNICACVETAGSRVDCIGRLTIYVTDKHDYERNVKAVGQAYRELMGRHFPAMTLVEVSRLLEKGALLELEATGVVPD